MGLFKFRKCKDASQKESILLNNLSHTYREAYRTLSANIEHIADEQKLKSILITSAIGNEGKTTVAINLGLTLANQGNSVLIINADRKNHKFDNIFNIANAHHGFFDIINNPEDSEQYFHHLENSKVDLLASGGKIDSQNLPIKNIKLLFRLLGEKYDFVIILSPTVNACADTAILAQCVDGVLLVVKQNGATSEEVLSTIDELKLSGANIIGTVFSHSDSMRRRTVLKKYNRLYLK
jgi:succinoglycan biosynthesis transport protein ExoP